MTADTAVLKRQAASGAVWTAAAQLGGQLLMLAANVVLARVLLPRDFGTASVALVVALVLTAVNQLGLGAAVVQRKKLERHHYDTAFWTSILSGFVFGASFYLAAVPLAALVRNQALVPVLRLYSTLFVLGGAAAVQTALLSREFRFRELAVVALAARLAGAAVSVVLALQGFGVMSIAWGYVCLNAVNALLLMPASGRIQRPRLAFSWHALREMMGFGSGIMGMNLLSQVSNGLDVIVVGRVMGPVSTGFYSVANQLVTYLPSRLGAVLAAVSFPAMARVQDRRVLLRSAYLRLTRLVALVVAPILAAIAVLAPDLVHVLYTAKWAQSVFLVQILAVYGLVVAFDWIWGQVFKALGRSWYLTGILAARIAGLVAAVVLGSRFGLAGVAGCVAGFGLLYWAGYQFAVDRALELRFRDYLRVLGRPLASTALAAAVMLGLRLAAAGIDPLPRLVLVALAGVACYLLVASRLNRAGVAELRDLVGGVLKRSTRTPGITEEAGEQGTPGRTRVCILTSVHPAADTRIYEKQALTLSAAGYDVTLVAPGSSAAAAADQGRVKLVSVRLPARRLARMTFGALLMLGHALRLRAAVYHFHDPELLPVGLALKALGKRVVYDVHEDYPEQVRSKHYLPGWLRPLAAWSVGLVEKAAARRLDAVIAATDAIAGKFHGSSAVVVRNYPKTPGMVATVRRRNPGQFLDSRPFRIVHLAGTLTEVRGITSIVRAMDYLDDGFELALAGRFVPAEYRQKLEGLAGFARVRYVEAIPHALVWQWYRQCDAGIVCSLPLRRHLVSLPVKMFEFMAAGLPVVASRFPLWQEIVERHRCGICVDPEAPEEIAAALNLLARDREKAQEMGRNGRRAVIAEYNWEHEAERLLAVYRRLGGPVTCGMRSAELGVRAAMEVHNV